MLIVLVCFLKTVSWLMWLASGIITIATVMLIVQVREFDPRTFSSGSLMVIAACVCRCMEINCTHNMDANSLAEIVMGKGYGFRLTAMAMG